MLRFILYVFTVYILVIPAKSGAVSYCAQELEPLPKSVIIQSSRDLLESLVQIEKVKNMKVEGLVNHPGNKTGIRVRRSGYVVGFYGALAVPAFVEDFPGLSRKLGFKLLERKADAKSRYDGEALFEVPDITAINSNIRTLRKAGELADNGFEFVYVKGQISDKDYLEIIRQGKVPFALDEHFFHDTNAHMIAWILLPRELAELFRDELNFMKFLNTSDVLSHYIHNSTDYLLLEQVWKSMARTLDTTASVKEDRFGLPNLTRIEDRIFELQSLQSLLQKTPFANDLRELLKRYDSALKKYGTTENFEAWIRQQVAYYKSIKLSAIDAH